MSRDLSSLNPDLACNPKFRLKLRQKIGRLVSVSDGVQMWRLKNATVTVMEGRRGEQQIRYTANRPITE